jgi:hypothetical protein
MTMFVHAVYFWLREDLTAEDEAAFKKGLDSLATIESAHQCYIGPPAATDRPVIDRSYSYALVVVFTDETAHDAYQVHPTHDAFRNDCAQYWTKVLIYDSLG